MSARALVTLAVGAVAVAAVLIVILSGGEDPYRVRLELGNAGGLREGRPVRIGGAEAGEVESLELGRNDTVVATLALESDARIGRGASAQIRASNLLSERFVELDPGNRTRPAPSGGVIPQERVDSTVDLDQLLDVLDADTRTRLGILINEAGLAFTGRRADFNSLLEELPPSLDAATELVGELVSDNHTLGELIERADRFTASLSGERRELGRLIDTAGQAMETVAGRQAEVRETLARAPGALQSAQRFLAELRGTTGPLGPAARAITASADPLASTLDELGPFQRAAQPAFEEATRTAPELTRLAEEATPVIRRANPTLRELVRLSAAMPPLGDALDEGIDDVLGTVEGWTRAIQTRDGLSHVFRAHASITPNVLRALVSNVLGPEGSEGEERKQAKRARAPRKESGTRRGREDGADAASAVQDLDRALDRVREGLEGKGLPDVLDPKGRRRSGAPNGEGERSVSMLLDFLFKR